jgi:endoglucanase
MRAFIKYMDDVVRFQLYQASGQVRYYKQILMRQIFLILGVILIGSFTSCSKKDNPPDPIFTVDPESLQVNSDGGNSTLNVSMNGSKWIASSNQTWCTVSSKSSYQPYFQVTVKSDPNLIMTGRTAILTFIMDSKITVKVNVVQEGQKELYPDYSHRIAPNSTGMGSSAKVLAAKMFAGWNLGNTLEVPSDETAWGNPRVTQIFIDSVRKAGINAIRIPCAWDSYLENTITCKIKPSWLARVKEVVDYCYNNDMYVILNTHWDGGWLQENPTYAKQFANNAKLKAIWQQIAVTFRNYDEHLLFAGTNEVNTGSSSPAAENFEVQLSYNQTFVDAVRSTGGKNSYRNLIVQAFNTNIDLAVSKLVVSNDTATNRLMVEVHYYDPWDFCGLETDQSWGKVVYLWGTDYALYGTISTWGQESYVVAQFQKMKTNFVDKGYPVILGEYGATRRSSLTGNTLEYHLASRAHYYQYVAQQAKNFGMVPFVWDNGYMGNFGSAIFNRTDYTTFDRQTLKAFITGATAGIYPF